MCIRRAFDTEHGQIRASVRGELVAPLATKATLERRRFLFAGPSSWNALPRDIRDFSRSLADFSPSLERFFTAKIISVRAIAFFMASSRDVAI